MDTDLVTKATSLQKEFHLRADALDADVAKLAAMLPTRRFRMRVRTTRHAQWNPIAFTLMAIAAYVGVAVPVAHYADGPTVPLVLATVGLFGALVGGIVGSIGSLAGAKVPLPYAGRVVVYVEKGHLATVPDGYEDIDRKWERKTCSQLIDEEGILVESLLAELRRGVDTYFARIEVLDAARDAVDAEKKRAEALAKVQGEVGGA